MRQLVALFAAFMLASSALGVVTPERLVAIVAGWPTHTRLYVAVGTRLVVGLIFILGAPSCRFPAFIRVVGIVALAAAILLLLLGGARVDALIQWWSQQPLAFIRAWCFVGMLLGALVLYAALSPAHRDRAA